jgi:hypothetical protein
MASELHATLLICHDGSREKKVNPFFTSGSNIKCLLGGGGCMCLTPVPPNPRLLAGFVMMMIMNGKKARVDRFITLKLKLYW